MSSGWYELKIIGKEVDRYRVSSADGKIKTRVRMKLMLKVGDKFIEITDMFGRSYIVEVDLDGEY